jgi:type II secretory pathway predicted ATPase ExeA/cell division septation protein DedD
LALLFPLDFRFEELGVYTNFYNLREKPFNLTPSPRFLYLGETHREALSLLTYGVTERKGFVLLTGEVGTGKTTIVQRLLKELDSSVKYVCVSNPTLSTEDFLFYVASGLGLKTQFDSKGPFLVRFEYLLQNLFQHQKNVLLIVDEAQKLSFELLEEIRLLSNMEMADEKLINIFLVGQPELNEKLSRPVCRPLLQRISIRYHIKPLDLRATDEYITTRLRVAGAENGYGILPKGVIKAIHEYSQGYPRMINILADNVLLLGYSKGTKRITSAMVEQCYDDMKLNDSFSKSIRTIPEKHETKKVKQLPAGSYWKLTLVLFCIIILAVTVMSRGTQDLVRRLKALVPISHPAFKGVAEEQVFQKEKVDQKRPTGGKNILDKETAPGDQSEEKRTDSVDVTAPEKSKEIEATPKTEDKETWKIIMVKRGDSLSELVASVYGRAHAENVNLVRTHNPEIEDINRIEVGQRIIFPPLFSSDQAPPFTVDIASFRQPEDARDVCQKLNEDGYEVYILPGYEVGEGKVFRVTLGKFDSFQNAEDFAATILKAGVSDYAKTIHLEKW